MKKKILLIAADLILIAAVFLLQNNICRLATFLSIAPNLLLVITFSIGFIYGSSAGMFTGFFAGLLLDAFSGGIFGFYILVYVYIGYLNGMLTRIFVNDNIILPLILCVISEIFYSLYSYCFGSLLIGRTNFADYLTAIALPEMVLTIFCSIILYGLILAVSRKAYSAEHKDSYRLS